MSKKRIRIEFESPEDVVKLNYFKNEVEFSEDKNFIITVDGTKDDFITGGWTADKGSSWHSKEGTNRYCADSSWYV